MLLKFTTPQRLRCTLAALLATAGMASGWAQAPAPSTAPAKPAAKSAGGVATPAGTSLTTQSGLLMQVITEGQGPSPTASDVVKVHYRGTLTDGKEFDSSIARGEPAEFPLNRVIKCWTEGVQKMKVGGKARLTCPPAIAYGERGAGGVIPPNATLVFEVELLAIKGRP